MQKWFFYFLLCGLVGCGLANSGNLFRSNSEQANNAGDGNVPTLRLRVDNNPELADIDCAGNQACETTCRTLYKDISSQKNCYRFTLGNVADMESLFLTLVDRFDSEARSNDLVSDDSEEAETLEDIKVADFERYIKIGIDGFTQKLIPKIIARYKTESDDKEYHGPPGYQYIKLAFILNWIASEEEVANVLINLDKDNKILKELMMAHCYGDVDGNSGNQCSNDETIYDNNSSPPSPKDLSGPLSPDLDDSDLSELWTAAKGAGGHFFKAAGYGNEGPAGLGKKLVDSMCQNSGCVRGFYCHLEGQNNISFDFDGDLTCP